MSTKCLITKLNASVNNEDLSYLDKLNIRIKYRENPKLSTYNIKLSVVDDTQNATIEGNGHFTDSTHAQDNGKTARLNKSTTYYSNGNYTILFPIDGITKYYSGDGYKGVEWDGFNVDYDRLISHNSQTLNCIGFETWGQYTKYIRQLPNINVIYVNENGKSSRLEPYINMIVEQDGWSNDFAIGINMLTDTYGTSQAIRRIKIITPNVQYEVWNNTNTTKLYTATKSGGEWTYVLEE